MTEKEVEDFLAIPNKSVLREISWDPKLGGHIPPFLEFASAISVNGVVLEGILFRASYRAPKIIIKGSAEVNTGESLSVALFANNHLRISAIDTNPSQRHINNVGVGRPFHGHTIDARTHLHIWVGSYGYVEPIEPALLEMEKMFEYISKCCNLTFTGKFVDPRKGSQGALAL